MGGHTLLCLVFLIISPTSCLAFDWGDFHKLAVIFGTFFGFGLGFTAILVVAYLACMKPFFENFREEVAQTHRTWHPWPIGSVRWQLQQLIRTGRSNASGVPGTQFPSAPTKAPTAAQYLNVPALQSSFGAAPSVYSNTAGIGGVQTGDVGPIIRSSDYNYNDPTQSTKPTTSYFQENVDRPTYFTPGPEKPIFEEYTIMREESFISRGSTRRPTTDNDNTRGLSSGTTLPVEEAQIVRSTTTRHSQRSLRAPGGSSTFI